MLKHGAELKRQINAVILDETNIEEKRRRENRLKEYERYIIEKSDKLKEKSKSMQEEVIKELEKSK